MRALSRATLLLLASAARAQGPAEQDGFDESHVKILTEADLADASLRPMLVDFYAPWCGHCKHLAPAYARAAAMVAAESGGSARLGKLDATAHGTGGHAVSGFPTLALINGDGSSENLKQLGPHNDAWIATWLLRKLAGSAVAKLESAADVEAFRQKAETTVVLYGGEGEGLAAFEQSAMQAQPTVRFAAAPLAAAAHTAPTLELFRETGAVTATAPLSAQMGSGEISSWVSREDVPMQIRNTVLHNTWMRVVYLLGESAASKHEHPFRQVYDFAAKGMTLVFEHKILSDPRSVEWVLAAGGQTNAKAELDKPTAAMVHVEKGRVRRVVLYGKPLLSEGLTAGSKGAPGTATVALQEWAAQFDWNAAALPKGAKGGADPAKGGTDPPSPSAGATPPIKL